jgi:hypothetical protein
MNHRLIGLGTGGVVLLTLASACGEARQDPQCVVARAVSDGSTGSFATTYTLKEGQDPNLACARLMPEAVGLQKYYSQDASAPDTVGLRSANMNRLLEENQTRLDPDAPNQPHSVGELTTEAPGPDNFCEVPSLTPARLEARSTGGATEPPLSVTYAWSNLRIYNTPAIPGTQFVADLRYTENDCAADFRVKGIWPVVKCGKKVGEEMVPDESKCDPHPNPAEGRLRGSGINPLFPVTCHPEALICVLTGEVPSDELP